MSKKIKVPADAFNFAFKNDIPLGNSSIYISHAFLTEKRQAESVKIMEKFHERIPVIIEKATSEQNLPDLD